MKSANLSDGAKVQWVKYILPVVDHDVRWNWWLEDLSLKQRYGEFDRSQYKTKLIISIKFTNEELYTTFHYAFWLAYNHTYFITGLKGNIIIIAQEVK